MLTDYRVRQRDHLLEISRALTAQLDLDELLQMVLEAAAEMLSGQAGLIALRDSDGDDFSIRASYGLPKALVPYFEPLLSNIPDYTGRSRFHIPGLAETLGQIVAGLGLRLQQVVALPMAIKHNLIGVLYVFRAYGSRFTPDDRRVLSSFADQAAIAVYNAQLYESVSQEKRRLDAILEYSADGVLIMDSAQQIVVFNRALARLSGWAAAEALGRHHDEVIQWAHLETDKDLTDAVAGGWPLPSARPLYVEGDLRRHSGGAISVGIIYAPLFGQGGRLVNIIANVRDVTRFREADEIKATFVSVISHELKTPVSLIQGYAETLLREDAHWDPDVTQESLIVIIEEAERLNHLIDNLLDASRLEAGKLPLNMEQVALNKLVERVAERFRTQTQSHEIKVDFPPEFPIIKGAPERLEQVLSNLLSNAIKYSPDGGQIQIEGRSSADEVIITVTDQGVGIPFEEQPHIFESFFRGAREQQQSTPGAGLGLYLAKAIIEAHNGRIWVESNSGEGASFSFAIPR
jgi:PAS domain S-box-containing protein